MVANENYHYQNDQSSRQGRYCPSSRQVEIVVALFDRMCQLFGNRWTSVEGEKMVDGKFTSNFLFWCRKTEGLEYEDWKRGFDRLEQSVILDASKGVTRWPPSYAEFIGLCRESKELAAHKYFKASLPESEDSKRQRKEEARQRMAVIKSILDE